jgi:hypothetical protein
MSLTQKFVFFLGIFSGASSSNVMQKNVKQCDISCKVKASPSSLPKVTNNPNTEICNQFSFLEQVGPHKLMPIMPLKESDKFVMGFGIQKRTFIEMSKKFSDIGKDLYCLHDIYDIVKESQYYIRSQCKILHATLYDQKKDRFEKQCYQLNLGECMTDIINGLEVYESALTEIIRLSEDGYQIPDKLEQMIIHLAQRHEIYVGKAFYGFKNKINSFYAELKRMSLLVEPSEEKEFRFHQQKLLAILDKHKAVYAKCKTRENIAYWKEKCMADQQLQLEMNSCFIDEYLSNSEKLLYEVQKYRSQINYLNEERYIDRIKKYFYGIFSRLSSMLVYTPSILVYYLYARASSLVDLVVEKSIKSILEKIKIEKIENFDQEIMQCERAQETKNKSKAQKIKMPANWNIPILQPFTELKKTVKKSESKKTDVMETTNDSEVTNTHNINTAKDVYLDTTVHDDISMDPWGVGIFLDSVKPIYLNSKVVGYAYFDPNILDSKFTYQDIVKMQQIYENGRMAPHVKNATGYKVFKYKKQQIWEFKIAGKNRLYGVPINADNKKTGEKIAPLIIFDISLRKKLGGND